MAISRHKFEFSHIVRKRNTFKLLLEPIHLCEPPWLKYWHACGMFLGISSRCRPKLVALFCFLVPQMRLQKLRLLNGIVEAPEGEMTKLVKPQLLNSAMGHRLGLIGDISCKTMMIAGILVNLFGEVDSVRKDGFEVHTWYIDWQVFVVTFAVLVITAIAVLSRPWVRIGRVRVRARDAILPPVLEDTATGVPQTQSRTGGPVARAVAAGYPPSGAVTQIAEELQREIDAVREEREVRQLQLDMEMERDIEQILNRAARTAGIPG